MKLNITSIVGIIIALVGLAVGFYWKGGNFIVFADKTAFAIVVVGTIGAVIAGQSMNIVKDVPKMLKLVFFERQFDYGKVIEQIEEWAKLSRTQGVLALESARDQIEDPFLKNGLSYIIDSIDPEKVREFLEIEISQMEERHGNNARFWESAGATAPTLGIMGAVMGLVVVLAGLGSSTMSELGHGVSIALLATFISLFIANVFFLPIASQLKLASKKEVLYREIVLEGILSIQAQESPIVVKKKLLSYLPYSERVKIEQRKEG